MGAPREKPSGTTWSGLSAATKQRAIEELKRRGRETWGPTYYSQNAPLDLCRLAGRPREVQYGALIGWVKRLGRPSRSDSKGAIEFVAHLLGVSAEDSELTTTLLPSRAAAGTNPNARRRSSSDEAFEVSCPSVVHDHSFVVLGELPRESLHAAVLLQPADGTGLWYPQVARHNPLRAGRAFCCLARLGNPSGIWHTKKLPLDAKVLVLALENEWRDIWSGRVTDDGLKERLRELGVVAERECVVSRVSTASLEPTLRDHGTFQSRPLVFREPKTETCVAPISLAWTGGAAYVEIRDGGGDRLLHGGIAASGATLVVHGGRAAPSHANVIFELEKPGPYRVRLYPAMWSFIDPPYEWWLDVT